MTRAFAGSPRKQTGAGMTRDPKGLGDWTSDEECPRPFMGCAVEPSGRFRRRKSRGLGGPMLVFLSGAPPDPLDLLGQSLLFYAHRTSWAGDGRKQKGSVTRYQGLLFGSHLC